LRLWLRLRLRLQPRTSCGASTCVLQEAHLLHELALVHLSIAVLVEGSEQALRIFVAESHAMPVKVGSELRGIYGAASVAVAEEVNCPQLLGLHHLKHVVHGSTHGGRRCRRRMLRARHILVGRLSATAGS
jgi:hypothetical protein